MTVVLEQGTAGRRAIQWLPYAVAGVGVAAILAGLELVVAVGVIAIGISVAVLAAFRRHPTMTVLAVWVITILETLVSNYVSGPLGAQIKTADEPLVLLLAIGTVLYHLPNRPQARTLVYGSALGFVLSGWASALLNGAAVVPTLLGTWQGMKIWTLLFITIHLPWRPADVRMLVRAFVGVVVVVLALGAVDFIAPTVFRSVFPVGAEGAELRFGRVGVQSIFGHPSQFGSFATIFSAFFLSRYVLTGNRRDLVLAVASLGLGIFSLRFKVLLGFLGVVGTLAIAASDRFFRRLGLAVMAGVVVLSLGGGIITDLASDQIDRYLLNDDSTIRQELYETSAAIGRVNFPFGEGLGRFGTGAATQFDSPVYNEYGLGSRAGLSQEVPGARHDTTWPTVLGETGYAGVAFFFGGLLIIWVRLLRQARLSRDATVRWTSLAAVVVLSDVLLESLGRPSFLNPVTSLTTALILGPALVLGARERASAWSGSRQPGRELRPSTELPDEQLV